MDPILIGIVCFGLGMLLGPFVLAQIKKLMKKND